MKFLLLTYIDEKATPEEQQRLAEICVPHLERLKKENVIVTGGPLCPSAAGATVCCREGEQLVTDGPFAETREQIGGCCIIEARDRDHAVELARGFVGDSPITALEVRQIADFDMTPPA